MEFDEMEHEQQEQPNIHRAYRALLAIAYEQFQMEHIALSSMAEVSGPDFESAWTWQRVAIEDAVMTRAPATYVAILISDGGSAVIPPDAWYDKTTPIGKKIAEFVAAMKSTFLVVSYASSSGHNSEHFTLLGTDGYMAREAHWSVEYKSFGRRKVWPMRRGEGKHSDTLRATGDESDPTTELPPWDDDFFLSDAAFEVRENRDARGRGEA
jgi:hypothetical protein